MLTVLAHRGLADRRRSKPSSARLKTETVSGQGGMSEAAAVAPGAAVLGRWAAAPHPQALQGGVGTPLLRRGAALRAPATSAERFAVLRGTLVTSSPSNTPRWIQCTCAPLGGVLGMVLGHAAEGQAGAQRQRWRGRRAVGGRR